MPAPCSCFFCSRALGRGGQVLQRIFRALVLLSFALSRGVWAFRILFSPQLWPWRKAGASSEGSVTTASMLRASRASGSGRSQRPRCAGHLQERREVDGLDDVQQRPPSAVHDSMTQPSFLDPSGPVGAQREWLSANGMQRGVLGASSSATLLATDTNVRYVDPGGSDATGTGSRSQPFRTVQPAIT